ncbi:PAS domain-containing protein [Mucilaginibacter sp. BJC16-A38]|uniref:PAS domain-containing sensor histidine kinase n=1 Tax=Mucilaginibacter phenanthrenivorans TaxID=1234842 RepID=UPI0021576DA0|nr:PAS domain S-box protein [Mucilaginibacter phenanthrenivorans]MCR8561511.1 PAS domain-containing protein [Mucilaginibacter phenanthrenivorans]
MREIVQLSAEDYHSVFNKSEATKLLLAIDAPLYTILDANCAYLNATNSTREALVGKSVFGAFPANPTDEESKNIERTIFSFEEAIRTKKPHTMHNYRYDIPIRDSNEFEERYWTTTNTPVLNEDGSVKFLIHSPTNVTEIYKLAEREKLAMEALRNQRKQLYAIFMQAPVGIGIFKGPEYIVDLINPPLEKIYGRSFDEMKGLRVFDALPSARGHGFEELLENVRLTGEPFYGNGLPIPLLRDGVPETVYVDFVYEPFRDDDGTIIGVICVATEITDKIEGQQRLEASEAQFRFMAESMPQQVWTADVNGALDYVNERTQDYFGKTAEHIIGAGWQEFIHPDDLQACLKNWAQALETKQLYQVEFRLRRLDGQYRWYLARALPFKIDDAVVMWLGTNTDIEEHKKIEQQKDEFISIASHELKTPLTSLKAYLQLMDRSVNNAESPGVFVSKSLQQLKRLEKLIADLLDVSKISAGKMTYNMDLLNMNELIGEVVQNVQLANTSHRLIVEGNPTVMLHGDHYRLEQVLTNFLTNAVKYSPDADEVIIRSEVQDDSIVVSVQDFGIGIERDNLGKLFERFYRVDNTAMKYEGLGLGLYVSAEILARHNGTFWIKSEFGKGSTFYFKLPLNV